MSQPPNESPWTRRRLLGATVAGAFSAAINRFMPSLGASAAPRDQQVRTTLAFTPFTAELPRPPTLSPAPPFASDCQAALLLSPLPPKYYQVRMRRGIAQIIPGVETEIWGYEGTWPGPTIRARAGEPTIVRQFNDLDRETSVHLHGGHQEAVSDGYPLDLIAPGAFRDYGYPQLAAGNEPGQSLSTIWYHDHAVDITAENVYHGLAGFYLVRDDLESTLIADGRLPADEFDLPLALQDRTLNPDGSLYFDPLNHDGFLGDLFCVNGAAQPFVRVRRRQYRLRILNGSTARVYMLRLSNDAPLLVVGSDSTLLPAAVAAQRILLGPAERADVIVDFRNAPPDLFLENIAVQTDGRGPGGTAQRPDVAVPGVPQLRFVVNEATESDPVRIEAGDPLRPVVRIHADDITTTRRFEFNRDRGAWTVNGQFFDPYVPIATPRIGEPERWILANNSGGWWHPIHIHQELHQVQSVNGRVPPPLLRGNKDTTLLGPNDVAEVFIRFREFPGRFVFHCHNLSHEDMAMMARFDVMEG
jgi:FtsP/CotA-like multicopper oxidase with cupredoxin domain